MPSSLKVHQSKGSLIRGFTYPKGPNFTSPKVTILKVKKSENSVVLRFTSPKVYQYCSCRHGLRGGLDKHIIEALAFPSYISHVTCKIKGIPLWMNSNITSLSSLTRFWTYLDICMNSWYKGYVPSYKWRSFLFVSIYLSRLFLRFYPQIYTNPVNPLYVNGKEIYIFCIYI